MGAQTSGGYGERNDYRDGQVLRARDLDRESRYFRAADRAHAGMAHRPGVLAGLGLMLDEQTGTVFVEAGLAIDRLGRMVVVPAKHLLDPEAARRTAKGVGEISVELLYREERAAPAGVSGGASTIVETTYEIRFAPAVVGSAPAGGPNVFAAAQAGQDVEAPIRLGQVLWTGEELELTDPFHRREIAGLTGRAVVDPDGQAELTLWDPDAVVVRTVGEEPDRMERRFQVSTNGTSWVERRLSVGEELGIRGSATADEPSGGHPWRVYLHRSDEGQGFSRSVPPPDAPYTPGEEELRIEFEADPAPSGLRRLVIGHRAGSGDFVPALAVYDSQPGGPNSASAQSTTKVFGDLYVTGTTWLRNAAEWTDSETATELSKILGELAGPTGAAIQAWLSERLSDDVEEIIEDKLPVVVNTLTDDLVAQIVADISTPVKLEAVAGLLAENAQFVEQLVGQISDQTTSIQQIADAVVGESLGTVADAVVADSEFAVRVVEKLAQDDPSIQQIATAIAGESESVRAVADAVVADSGFAHKVGETLAEDSAAIQQIAAAIAGGNESLAAMANAVVGSPQFAEVASDALVDDHVSLARIASTIREDPAWIQQVAAMAVADPSWVQQVASTIATNTGLSQQIAEAIANSASASQQVADSIIANTSLVEDVRGLVDSQAQAVAVTDVLSQTPTMLATVLATISQDALLSAKLQEIAAGPIP